jgi:hypothetical protein
MIITDKQYCRRCRKYNQNTSKRTNYCTICQNKIAVNKQAFNRWQSSASFIETSFVDCIEGNCWNGFKSIEYNLQIIDQIINKFPEIKYHTSTINKIEFKKYNQGNFIYFLSDNTNTILKVGQTQNLITRFNHYYDISKHLPIKYHVFSTETYDQQDLYEDKIRNYLEFLGYELPEDNTGLRLKYINNN